jgi:hypothetical protein
MDREQLLKEIFALEPDLRAKESEVRALVFSMLEHKPVIVPDLMMKAVVRARLIAQFETNNKSIKSPWIDWLWYAAPIGAAAVVILMMVPSYYGPSVPYLTPSPVAPVIRSGGVEAMSAPSQTVPVGESAAKMEAMQEEADTSSSDMRAFGTMSAPSIDLPNQKAGNIVRINGVFSELPVFVAVYVSGSVDPVGLSKLIMPGDTAPFVIGLSVPIRVGGNYEVVVFADNGDGSFSKLTDNMSYSASIEVLP